MASIDSTVVPHTSALLRIACLAKMGAAYANSQEAEFINLEVCLDVIEQIATRMLAELES